MDDSPAQKANAFASAAEEFTARGNLLKAVEAHFRAAEQYLLAMNDTSDPEAVKTLKLLYASHTRSGKELQRRVQQPPAAVSAPPQQQPISTSPSAMPGHLGEIGGSVPARSSPSPAPTPPQSALSSSPASGVSVLSRSSMPHSATTPPSGLPQALAAAQQQRRPGAIHLYSNTAATGPGSTSAAGSSPTPAAATAPGLAGTTPQSTHIATLAADLAESSILGSRQFFVGQSQSDSTILPTRTRAAAQQQSLLGGPSFGPGGIQISGGAHTAGQVSRAAPSSGTPQYHTQHRFSAEPATVPVKSLDQSDSVSSQSIAHSYLMLDENAKEIRRDDEPEDPFNKFWEAVEGLVQKISVSAPVAFTTVPLQGERRPLSADLAVKRASSFTDETRDPATNPPSQYSQPQQYATLPPSGRQSQTKRVEGIVQGSPTDLHDPMQSTAILQSYLLVPSDVPLVQSPHGAPLSQAALQRAGSFSSHTRRESSLGSLDEAKGSQRSGTGVGAGAGRKKTLEEYQIENDHLKQIVDRLTKRVALLEKTAEENNMLRSSIIQFRQDVQKQAKRFMHGNPRASSFASMHNESTGSSMRGQPPSGSAADMRMLQERVRQLEAELLVARAEIEQQSAAAAKYKDRWDKLKESAKKKKEARSSQDLSSTIGPGDPEASLLAASAAGVATGTTEDSLGLSTRSTTPRMRTHDLPPLPPEGGRGSPTPLRATGASAGAQGSSLAADAFRSSRLSSSPRGLGILNPSAPQGAGGPLQTPMGIYTGSRSPPSPSRLPLSSLLSQGSGIQGASGSPPASPSSTAESGARQGPAMAASTASTVTATHRSAHPPTAPMSQSVMTTYSSAAPSLYYSATSNRPEPRHERQGSD